MAVRYKDRLTGLYVSKKTWAQSRGKTGRYVRIDERYGTGKRNGGKRNLPKAKPPIDPSDGPMIERIRYQEADKHRSRDIEVITKKGQVVSVRVGQRVYTHRSDFAQLKHLVEAARIEGKEITEAQFRSTGSRKRHS